MRRTFAFAALSTLTFGLVAAACGDDDDTPAPAGTSQTGSTTSDSMTDDSMTDDSMTDDSMTDDSMTDG